MKKGLGIRKLNYFFYLSFLVFLLQSCSPPAAEKNSAPSQTPNPPKDANNQHQNQTTEIPFIAGVKNLLGPITARTFSVIMTAQTEDVGKEGAIYVAAILKDGSFYYLTAPGKWQFQDAQSTTPPPALIIGKIPATFESGVEVAGVDLTPYLGAKVYIGYGLGGAPYSEMMNAKRYLRFYELTEAQ